MISFPLCDGQTLILCKFRWKKSDTLFAVTENSIMVKTERTIDDDGVDLSYDSATSAVKKEITHPGSSHPLDVIHRLKSEGLNMGAGSAHSTNTTSSHFYSQPQHSPQSAAAAGSHSMPQQPASPASSRGSVGTNAGGSGGTSSTPGGRLKFFRGE